MRIAVTLSVVGLFLIGPLIVGRARTSDQQNAAGQKDTSASIAQTCTLRVSGMVCEGCAVAVKIAAGKIDGVQVAKVSYDQELAEITYDPAKVTPEAIAQAITKNSGLDAEVAQEDQP